MEDYCKYVDVFYGNGEVNEFPESGEASKWLYIKALCGNTTPHAVLPFGEMSVGAYSSGYPTGYGTHYPNSCGGIKKLWDNMKIRGFSHLHQSGTGAIEYYYNYAVVTPFYGELKEIEKFRDIKNEKAKPGEYSVELDKIKVSLTVTHNTAFHLYKFENENGRVAVDFSNNGLSREFEDKYRSSVKNARVITDGEKTVFFKAELSGIMLYFCVRAEGKNVSSSLFEKGKESDKSELKIKGASKSFGAVFDFDGDELQIKVAFSTIDFSHAKAKVNSLTGSFEETAEKAYQIWNEHLSAIEIKTEDEELKEKFYSNFYHSLIKPSIIAGENVLGVEGDTVVDYATFWDQYKTLYPLIFILYPEEGRSIANGIANISKALGKIPCSFGLADVFPCENQAKMLGIIALCDAYYAGMTDEKTLTECVKRELERKDYGKFLKSGFFERYTHILDVTDACLDVSDITKDESLKKWLAKLSQYWKNAYGDDGLMSEKSPYYEGDRYTYSFRLQSNMEQRVELAGGKEKFALMLDDFFGFGKESVKQITTLDNPRKKIAEAACHRFEGFNNECDMETPFAYIFADRHDRLCSITAAAVNDSFKTGRGGLPGNNDSGGLSSCFMWLVLGLFPWAGTGKMLVGCPQTDGAVMKLSNGNVLEISVEGDLSERKEVKEVLFNGSTVENYVIPVKSLLEGGKLIYRF